MKSNNTPKTWSRAAEGASGLLQTFSYRYVSATINRQYLWKFYCSGPCFKQFLEITSFGPVPYEMPSVVISVLFTGQWRKGPSFVTFCTLDLLSQATSPSPIIWLLLFNFHELNSLVRKNINMSLMKIKIEMQEYCFKTPKFSKSCGKKKKRFFISTFFRISYYTIKRMHSKT